MKINRQYHYDYIRVIATFCIIAIHSTDLLLSTAPKYNGQWWFGTLFQLIVRIGLPIFFMISGALILNSNNDNILEFYKKRFLRILLPLFIYSFIYLFVFNYKFSIFKFDNFYNSIKLILSNNVHYHLWFIYTILGIYLCAPFLKIMVRNLNDNQFCILIIVVLIFRFLYTYLSMIGIDIGINSIIFDGWVFYFLLGSFLTRNFIQKHIKIINLIDIISFIISLIILRFFPKLNFGIFDYAPTMIFMATSCFAFFEINKNKINEEKPFYKIVLFISKYSYSIYLIHAMVLSKIVNCFFNLNTLTYNFVFGSIFTILITFSISIILAFIIDNLIINPIYKIIYR